MKRRNRLVSASVALGTAVVLLSGAAGIVSKQAEVARAEFNWNLPRGFPVPRVPEDNPMSVEKVELGRRLFYDTRLSGNGKFSCATCHQQEHAFADARPRGVGSTGEVHPRGSMSLTNVAYSPTLTWANPARQRLEEQALVPMFGVNPVELGLAHRQEELLARLSADSRYQAWFRAAFRGPGVSTEKLVTLDNITKALASFERTIISGNSAYDRAQHGDSNAMTVAEERGQALFTSDKLNCSRCHGGFNFTSSMDHADRSRPEIDFHNTGLYNLDGKGAYPRDNPGLRQFTQRPEDEGKFKAPSLRNIALTAPYMHDGSIETLEQVIDHYSEGGRTIPSGPNKGLGSTNPNRSEFITRFDITAEEKKDLVSFLRALTDSSFIRDAKLSDPWSDTANAGRSSNKSSRSPATSTTQRYQ